MSLHRAQMVTVPVNFSYINDQLLFAQQPFPLRGPQPSRPGDAKPAVVFRVPDVTAVLGFGATVSFSRNGSSAATAVASVAPAAFDGVPVTAANAVTNATSTLAADVVGLQFLLDAGGGDVVPRSQSC